MEYVIKHTMSEQNNDNQNITLLEGCVRGERLYQKKLYELHYSKMMAICLRYTNNREEARDILHEGFIKVFLHINTFKPHHSLESWIKRIMINTAIDHYRKNKKFQFETDLENAYFKIDNNSTGIVNNLSAEEIMKLVQKLSPAYRTVFNLYVIEGFTHREIAEMLKINEGTSKSNLAKARIKLQEMLKEDYNISNINNL